MDYTGQKLEGRYMVIKRLGYGGMGAVYRGHHMLLDRHVAIKFLHADLVQDEEMIKRFYREARAAAAIKHENIIDVLDVGMSSEGEPYLVMEYLQGESLAAMLERTGPMEVSVAVGILEPALRALVAAHSKGIVHRDLKPENIFLVDRGGRQPPLIKLIDFGVSKFTRGKDNTQLTKAGSVLGTPAYMSPEQVRGDRDIDYRTDIYAMGAILYEMLTGRLPFVGTNYMELLERVLTTNPTLPSACNPNVDPNAEAVVLRAMSKRVQDRYQSAEEMLADLRRIARPEARDVRLSQIMSTISKLSYAHGDLGVDAVVEDQTGVVDLEAHRGDRKGDTPGVWAGTVAPKRGRLGLYLGLVGLGAAMALVIIGAVFLAGMDREPLPEGEAAPAAAAALPDEARDYRVVVTVEGAPKDAKVYYQGIYVPMNPFPVKRDTTITPLKVEAPGYETFTIAIVPSEDRIVKVALEPLPGTAVAAPEPAEKPKEPSAEKATSPKGKVKGEPSSEPAPQSKPGPELVESPNYATEADDGRGAAAGGKKPGSAKAEGASDATAETTDTTAEKKDKKKKGLKKKGRSGEFAASFE